MIIFCSLFFPSFYFFFWMWHEIMKIFIRVKDCRDTSLTLNIMIQQKGRIIAQHLLRTIHLKYEMMIAMEPYFRSESDSCSTIFSCGPMHELCMRKHLVSYCYPIVFVDDNHLWILMNIIPTLFARYRMCFVFITFVSLFFLCFTRAIYLWLTFMIFTLSWIKWISPGKRKWNFTSSLSWGTRKHWAVKISKIYVLSLMSYRYETMLKAFYVLSPSVLIVIWFIDVSFYMSFMFFVFLPRPVRVNQQEIINNGQNVMLCLCVYVNSRLWSDVHHVKYL